MDEKEQESLSLEKMKHCSFRISVFYVETKKILADITKLNGLFRFLQYFWLSGEQKLVCK